MKTYLAVAFAFLAGCGVQPVLTALEVLAPVAKDAITMLVQERWGSRAEVDVETASCFRTDEQCGAQLVGDDEIDFVYTTCRGKAR